MKCLAVQAAHPEMYALKPMEKMQHKVPDFLLESIIGECMSFHNTSNKAIYRRVSQEEG